MSSIIIDINRDRAMQSYLNIESFKKSETKENQEKMKSYCRKLPSMLKVNGLIETLVYLKSKSKGKEGEKTIYGVLEEWLEECLKMTFKELESDKLVLKIAAADLKNYRNYTEELMNISIWYKRHAEALL